MEDAYKKLQENHEVPGLKETIASFDLAMMKYRDLVLEDIVMASIAATGDHSGKEAISAEWGGENIWQKATESTGTSSRMSTVAEDAESVEQKFEDDTGETVTFADEVGAEKAQIEKAPQKKVVKKVQRVNKRHEPKQGETAVGSQLDELAIFALKSVSYFIPDICAAMSKDPEESTVNSINTGTATIGDVCLMVDTAAMDIKSTGTTASASLGIDGEISGTCTLPKLTEKLVRTWA